MVDLIKGGIVKITREGYDESWDPIIDYKKKTFKLTGGATIDAPNLHGWYIDTGDDCKLWCGNHNIINSGCRSSIRCGSNCDIHTWQDSTVNCDSYCNIFVSSGCEIFCADYCRLYNENSCNIYPILVM